LHSQKALQIIFKIIPKDYDWNRFPGLFERYTRRIYGEDYVDTVILIVNVIINTKVIGPIAPLIDYWDYIKNEGYLNVDYRLKNHMIDQIDEHMNMLI